MDADGKPGPRLARVLGQGGEMGRLIAGHDWATTPLGPLSAWPEGLQTALNLCLMTRSAMLLMWGPELTLLYNDRAIDILGVKHPRGALGLPLAQVFPEVWDTFGPIFAGIMGTGEPHIIDNQLFLIRRQVPLQEIYVEASYIPIMGADGAPAGTYVTCIERTDAVVGPRRARLLHQVSLQAAHAGTAEAAYRAGLACVDGTLGDLSAALLYVCDPAASVARLLGVAGVEPPCVRALAQQPLAASDAPGTWPLHAAATAGLQVVADLSNLLHPLPLQLGVAAAHTAVVLPLRHDQCGAPHAFLVAVTNPFQPLGEDALGFYGLLANILGSAAANATAMAQERQRGAELAALDRTKTAFFSNVSHEFRTPLTLMLGPTEEALRRPDGALAGADLGRVHRNQVRLLKLVNALLDFSAVEAGRAAAHLQPVDLAAVTAELAAAFTPLLQREGLRLEVDCPPQAAPVWVDPDKWEKIVLNLVSNAFKYTESGLVSVRLRREGEAAVLAVQDTGCGIPDDQLPLIFERFHRVHNSGGRTHEGTGIGLSLVWEFAQLHGGSVEVQSVAGVGSTFTVRVPAMRREAGAAAPVVARASAGPVHAFAQEAARWQAADALPTVPAARADAPRVLLAEDNADMRAYITGLLGGTYQVETVADGQAALEAIARQRPDLVLTDVMMPRVDGLQLLQALRAHPEWRTLPVILLSARVGEDAAAEGLHLQADDYLSKPFSAKELLARMESQLALVRMRQQVAVQTTSVALLGRQEAWLRALLDVVPVPLLLLQQGTGEVLVSNQAARAMAGHDLAPGTVLAQLPPPFAMHAEDGAPFPAGADPVSRASASVSFRDAELRWTTARAEYHLLVDAEAVEPLPGQPPAAVLCLRDVTRLRDVQRELQRMLNARDDFLCLASHELKTPLTSLTLQTHMALRRLRHDSALPDIAPLVPMFSKFFAMADDQLRRLAHLVDDMLDIGRIESGKLTLSRESCDLGTLAAEVVERLQQLLDQHGAPVVLEAAPVLGTWDRFRIEQVLINLLTNAARYGAGKPVRVSVLSEADMAVLSVEDQGHGVAPEDRERIFERFERAVSRHEVSGLGLGLFIVQQIVRLHRGTVQVEDPMHGTGARFVVRLPRSPDAVMGQAERLC